jgi:hypothetical protein
VSDVTSWFEWGPDCIGYVVLKRVFYGDYRGWIDA